MTVFSGSKQQQTHVFSGMPSAPAWLHRLSLGHVQIKVHSALSARRWITLHRIVPCERCKSHPYHTPRGQPNHNPVPRFLTECDQRPLKGYVCHGTRAGVHTQEAAHSNTNVRPVGVLAIRLVTVQTPQTHRSISLVLVLTTFVNPHRTNADSVPLFDFRTGPH